MKTKVGSFDKITRKGKKGFFVPEAVFSSENCIIIVTSQSENPKDLNAIIGDESRLRVYSAAPAQPENAALTLRAFRIRSPLFKSLKKSLNEVISHKRKGSRPKTFDEFLEPLFQISEAICRNLVRR
jgi:hypothetical protein